MQGLSKKYLDLQVNISSYPLSLLIFSLSQSLLIFARSLTKIGQTSMNQVLMVVATESCSLLFDIYPGIICEASLNGCSHQVMFGFHLTNTYIYIIYIFLSFSFFLIKSSWITGLMYFPAIRFY